jgi:cytochrome c nitrite reductase small subunit
VTPRRAHRGGRGTGVAAAAAALVLGLAAGLGAFTFIYAKGASYLTTDPAACANCHVMSEHYAAWQRSSHRAAATCADCHMPHDIVGKYAAKASNGFWHSVAFTTGRFPDPLLIKPHNRAIVERACRDCHAPVVEAIDAVAGGATPTRAVPRIGEAAAPAPDRPQVHDGIGPADERLSCVRCHVYVGHWVR